MEELDLVFFKNMDINLEMEKINNFPEERYVDEYVIQDINNNKIDFLVNILTVYNKFYITEIYKVSILFVLNSR
jgi:hypothetical protein